MQKIKDNVMNSHDKYVRNVIMKNVQKTNKKIFDGL